MAAHALEADVTLIVLALAAGHAGLLPSYRPQPWRPGTLRVGSAVLAPSWRRVGARWWCRHLSACLCLPVFVCLSLPARQAGGALPASSYLVITPRRAVRYVGLTTTVFASRSAYKYAKEKRADAARAD